MLILRMYLVCTYSTAVLYIFFFSCILFLSLRLRNWPARCRSAPGSHLWSPWPAWTPCPAPPAAARCQGAAQCPEDAAPRSMPASASPLRKLCCSGLGISAASQYTQEIHSSLPFHPFLPFVLLFFLNFLLSFLPSLLPSSSLSHLSLVHSFFH